MKKGQSQRSASVHESQMATVPGLERNQNKKHQQSTTEATQACEEMLVTGSSWRCSELRPDLAEHSGSHILLPVFL